MTVPTTADAVLGVESMDVDELSDEEGTPGATVVTTKEQGVLKSEVGYVGSGIKNNSNYKGAPAESKPLMNNRIQLLRI